MVFLGGPFWEVSGSSFAFWRISSLVLHFIAGGLGCNFRAACMCVSKRHAHVVNVWIMLHVMCL